MSFISILKTIGKVGASAVPIVVGAYNPALGALTSSILTSVVNTQADHGDKPGSMKKDLALAGVQVAIPAITAMLADQNKHVHDPDKFAAGVAKIQDGIVDLLNSSGDKVTTK